MNSQHKAVAKGTNMSHEWIRKEIKRSAEMLHLNEMSVRWVWFFLQFGHLKLNERCWENWREFPELFKTLKTFFIVSGLNPNLFSLSTRMQRAGSVTVCSLPLGLEIAHIYGSLIPSQWEPTLGMLRLAMCVLQRLQNKPFNSRPADVMKSLSLEMSKSRLCISLDAQVQLTGMPVV